MIKLFRVFNCREGGDTSPQNLILTFSYSNAQQPRGVLLNFDWFVHLVECPKVSTTNCILQTGNFVYHHWGLELFFVALLVV